MGVPSEKASDAAAIILREAEYLRGLDPVDVYATTRDALIQALSVLEQVVWADALREDEA